MLAGLREVAREAVSRHGGRIARIQGDGLLAIFGYPESSEHDARRAVEAALDLRAGIEALRVEGLPRSAAHLGMHAGVHAGLVLVVDGDMERGRFDLVGDATHTAARLCSLARDGEICVSALTLGPAARLYAAGEERTLAIKGHDDPLHVHTIVARAGVQRRYEASASKGLAAFVGRSEARQRLREQWQSARAGANAGALVTGQPGLGKTRLLEEFMRWEADPGAIVLRGYCESYLAAEPLQPFRQILRAVVGEAGGSGLEDWLVKAGVDAELARDPLRWADAIAACIGRLAEQAPVLLVLDDWQWADDASRQALDRILELPRRVCTIVASRNEAGAALGLRQLERVDLRPLQVEETRQVVNHWLRSPDPFLVDEIHGYGGGIPLFVEELCHAVAADGRLNVDVPGGGTSWLAGLVESRVARLDDASAEALRVAAVLGNTFPAWLLDRVADAPTDDPRLRSLAEQDFLFPADQPGLLRFKHGLTRDAVYATVSLADRRRLHGRVAAFLEAAQGEGGGATIEALAYHLDAAGQSSRAAQFAESAGDRAMASNALDRARAQYTAALRGLDALERLDEDDTKRWCRAAQKLGMACVFDPISIPDRESLLERAVMLAGDLGDANMQARAEYWLGYSRYAVGRARSGLPHCERALALARASGDARLASQVRATLGQALTAVCRYDEALPLLDEAISAKRRSAAPNSSTAIGSAFALAAKGLLLTDRGQFGAADESFAEARLLLGASAHPVASSVCGLMGIALLWQGRWAEAMAVADEGARVAQSSRSRQLLAMGQAIAGYARWMSAGDPRGQEAIVEAIGWIEARAGRFMVSLLYGWLIEGAVAAGDETAARRHMARLLLRARDGDRIGEAMGCRAMADLVAARGRHVDAQRWLARADGSAAARGSPHEAALNAACAARLALMRGERREAAALHEQARGRLRQLGMRWHAERAEVLNGLPGALRAPG